MELGFPARTARIRRVVARLCADAGWAALHEVTLDNGRRADLFALRPDGGFVIVEIKSGERDFCADGKWPEYRPFCDALFFAVDLDFPTDLLPDDAGLIVADTHGAEVLRDAPGHPLPAARRRALLHRFAMLAAGRLAAAEDPAGQTERFAALRVA